MHDTYLVIWHRVNSPLLNSRLLIILVACWMATWGSISHANSTQHSLTLTGGASSPSKLGTVANSPNVLPAPKSSDQIIADWLAHRIERLEATVSPVSEEILLKFSHPGPPSSLAPSLWSKADRWLSETTGGGLRVKQYGGGVLHSASGGFKAVRGGVTDFATCYSALQKKGFELTTLLTQPFVLPENPVLSNLIIRKVRNAYLDPEYRKRGVELGYISPVSKATILSRSEIRSPDDLRGMKVVFPGATRIMASELNISLINVPFPEIYTAVQQGMADAVIWVDSGFIPFKIYEHLKYKTDVSLSQIMIDICVNKDRLKKLPSAYQTAFNHMMPMTSLLMSYEIGHKYAKTAKTHYNKADVKIVELTRDERKQWELRTAPVLNKWLDVCDKRGKPCRQLLREVKKLEEQYKNYNDAELMSFFLETL